MRRTASLFLLALPLAGCGDFVDFIGDTATIGTSPNSPSGNSETMRRVRGLDTPTEPLTPEPGNVWPGPVQTPPTLKELEANPAATLSGRSGGFDNGGVTVAPPDSPATANAPDHRQPRPASPPRGSSTPPGSAQPGLPPATSLGVPDLSAPRPGPNESGRAVIQPGGQPGVTTGGNQNYKTFNTPGAPGGIMVPNGNGTSTLIKPDGTISTVPTPR